MHPRTLWGLYGLLKGEKIDLLDCHSGRDSYYGAYVKWLTGIAVVRSRHVTDRIKTDGMRGWMWRHGNHAIITTADKIREMLLAQNLRPAERIFVAPAGVDAERFSHTLSGHDLRQELGIPRERLIVANIGMIRRDKGQAYFVEAARILLDQGLPMTFIQVGDATTQTRAYKDEVMALAGEYLGNGIRFLGYHEDIENYIALADLVAISSIKTEARTRLVGQATLMKKNVVATEAGGLPEMITHNETGLLCEPGSASSLATAIMRLYRDPQLANYLRENAFARAQREMTFDRMMNAMLQYYLYALRFAGRSEFIP